MSDLVEYPRISNRIIRFFDRNRPLDAEGSELNHVSRRRITDIVS